MEKLAGRHLIIDGISMDVNKLTSIENVTDYLYDVTKTIGMTMVYPPITAKFPFAGELNKFVKDLQKENFQSKTLSEMEKLLKFRDKAGGVSSISVWLESHLAVHTWSEEMYVSLDLFSCKNYDIKPVIELSKTYFDFKHLNILNISRYVGRFHSVNKFEMLTCPKCNEFNTRLYDLVSFVCKKCNCYYLPKM